jgi:hypothetical protein
MKTPLGHHQRHLFLTAAVVYQNGHSDRIFILGITIICVLWALGYEVGTMTTTK